MAGESWAEVAQRLGYASPKAAYQSAANRATSLACVFEEARRAEEELRRKWVHNHRAQWLHLAEECRAAGWVEEAERYEALAEIEHLDSEPQ
jgi:hypothetical protein